jgi:hypothetical protein
LTGRSSTSSFARWASNIAGAGGCCWWGAQRWCTRSPDHYIPLPAGYADRHVYIGTYGQVDAFHFDLYSTALSKIERGRVQDLRDVVLLLQDRRIKWQDLERYFHEILPKMGLKSLRQDPAEFEKNFRALEALWRAAGGNP